MIIIPLGSDVRAEVIDSVIGQLSDGIWENSNAMNKYRKYADVNKNNELEVDDSRWESGFRGKDEAWIKNWFANKAKQVVKIWADDWGKGKDIWSRDNTSEVDYMGGHIVRDITVADVYECYDYLKGRAKARKYGAPEKEVPVEEPISSTPAPTYTSPKTSGGMNPSQQELEDFFLDASTRVRKRGISASRRTFTKYPSSYIEASSDGAKRYYVYYTDTTDLATYELNAILSNDLEYYGAQVNFGYRDSKCRSYGANVSVCIITSKKPIAKAKLQRIIKDSLDIDVLAIEVENFE